MGNLKQGGSSLTIGLPYIHTKFGGGGQLNNNGETFTQI